MRGLGKSLLRHSGNLCTPVRRQSATFPGAAHAFVVPVASSATFKSQALGAATSTVATSAAASLVAPQRVRAPARRAPDWHSVRAAFSTLAASSARSEESSGSRPRAAGQKVSSSAEGIPPFVIILFGLGIISMYLKLDATSTKMDGIMQILLGKAVAIKMPPSEAATVGNAAYFREGASLVTA